MLPGLSRCAVVWGAHLPACQWHCQQHGGANLHGDPIHSCVLWVATHLAVCGKALAVGYVQQAPMACDTGSL
jgi:hypothetical protein